MSERNKTKAELQDEIASLKKQLSLCGNRAYRQEDAEKPLIGLRKNFFAFVEHAPHYLVVVDPSHDGGPAIETANPAACAIHGFTEKELKHQPFTSLFVRHHRKFVTEQIGRALSNKHRPFECDALRKNGSTFPVRITTEMVTENGRQFVFAIEHTLIDQKNAEKALRYSERQLANLMDNIPGIAYRCRNDLFWTMEFISNGCLALTGYPADDLIHNRKKAFTDLVHPDDLPGISTAVGKALKKKKPFEIEYRIITAEGSTKHVWEKGLGVEEPGEGIFLEGFITDITERKNAENAKKASEERYRFLFDNMFLGVAITNAKGKIHVANKALCNIVGYSQEEIVRLNSRQFYVDPDERDRLIALLRKNGILENFETRIKRKNGKQIWLHYKVYPFDYEGEAAFFITCIDITERKQIELQLRKLSAAVEQSPISIIITDKEGDIEYVNPAFVNTTGYRAGEVAGRNLRMFKTPERPDEYYRNIWKTISEGAVWQGEFHSRKKNGELFWEKTTIGPITEAGGEISHFIALNEDITEKRSIEHALQQSEEKYRKLVEGSIQGVIIAQDDPLRISYASQPMEAITGYTPEELVGLSARQVSDMVHPEDRDIFFAQFRKRLAGKKKKPRRDYRILHKNGSFVWVAVHSTAIEYNRTPATQTVFLDITNYKKAETQKEKLEEQLRQAQKLETIGTLAAGIAHDFNNILTPILGYAEMAKLRMIASDPNNQYLDSIVKAAHRAKKLIAQILTFNRQAAQQQKPVSLHPIVTDVMSLLIPSIPAGISVRQLLSVPCAEILADPEQMHQVVMNLCTNAVQAMQKKGGTLTVGLKPVHSTLRMAKAWPGLKPGLEYIRLTICDTGIGISKKNLERIFEPFFSTKPPDKGTGLGLSVVHGIIQSHHGTITIHSKPGKGTAVHVYFPLGNRNICSEKPENAVAGSENESILVIDDETAVTETISHMLDQLGYHAVTGNDSVQAVTLFSENPSGFELVITDLFMPEMNGFDVAEKVRAAQPGVPVIIIAGNDKDIDREQLRLSDISTVLVKPVAFSELAAAVRKALYQNLSGKTS